MEWWQWIALGCFVLAAELIVDAEFYLVFLGVSAIAVGLNNLAPLHPPVWGQWLLFSTVAVLATVFFRKRVYERIRGQLPERQEGVVGELGVAREAMGPGEFGQVELRGIAWSARNTTNASIPLEARVRVEGSDGFTLLVRQEST